MNSNELRIGNILKDKLTGTLLRVDELTIEGKIVTYVIDRSKYPLPKGWQIAPVEISEEILLKCGFEKCQLDNYSYLEMKVNNTKYITNDKGNVLIGVSGPAQYEYLLLSMEYLHQLQNIHFMITGQELTINF